MIEMNLTNVIEFEKWDCVINLGNSNAGVSWCCCQDVAISCLTPSENQQMQNHYHHHLAITFTFILQYLQSVASHQVRTGKIILGIFVIQIISHISLISCLTPSENRKIIVGIVLQSLSLSSCNHLHFEFDVTFTFYVAITFTFIINHFYFQLQFHLQ